MALTSVSAVQQQLGITGTVTSASAFSITLDVQTEVTATIEVTATACILTPTGGSGTPTATVLFADYTTIQAVVDRLNVLGAGNKWEADLADGVDGTLSSELLDVTAAVTLQASNRTEHITYSAVEVDSDAALISNLIDEVSDAIPRYCGRTLEQTASVVRYYDGNGHQRLWLDEWPMASTPTIALVSNAGQTETALTSGTDFWVPDLNKPLVLWSGSRSDWGGWDDCTGYAFSPTYHRHRYGSGWPVGVQNIKVTATVGYSPVPDDLEGIARRMVVGLFLNRTRNPNVGDLQTGGVKAVYRTPAEAVEHHRDELAAFKRRFV